MLTFEQFQATRREVADLRTETGTGDDLWEQPTPGYVYDYDGFIGWIEKCADGRVYLLICNEDWLEDADKLPDLERELYEYMHGENTP